MPMKRLQLWFIVLAMAISHCVAGTALAATEQVTTNSQLARSSAIALCHWDYEIGQPSVHLLPGSEVGGAQRYLVHNVCQTHKVAIVEVEAATAKVRHLTEVSEFEEREYNVLLDVLPGAGVQSFRLLLVSSVRDSSAVLLETDRMLNIKRRTLLPWVSRQRCASEGQPFYQLKETQNAALSLMAVDGANRVHTSLRGNNERPLMACDAWGEVTLVWRRAQTNVVRARRYDRMLSMREQRQWSRTVPTSMLLTTVEGHTQLSWRTTRGHFEHRFVPKRLIDGSFSGVWHNAQLPGQGLVTQVTRQQGQTVVTANVLTFDEQGDQDWVFMSGVAQENSAQLAAFRASGGGIGSTGTAQVDDWGSVVMRWTGCHRLQLTMRGPGGRLVTSYFSRLHNSPDLLGVCARQGTGAYEAAQIERGPLLDRLPRLWHSNRRGGHGVMLDVSEVDGNPVLNLFLTSFGNERVGAPVWFAAFGEVESDATFVRLQAVVTRGGGFLQPGDNEVEISPAGWIRLERRACNRLRLTYNLDGLGKRREFLRPLGPTLLGDAPACN